MEKALASLNYLIARAKDSEGAADNLLQIYLHDIVPQRPWTDEESSVIHHNKSRIADIQSKIYMVRCKALELKKMLEGQQN